MTFITKLLARTDQQALVTIEAADIAPTSQLLHGVDTTRMMFEEESLLDAYVERREIIAAEITRLERELAQTDLAISARRAGMNVLIAGGEVPSHA